MCFQIGDRIQDTSNTQKIGTIIQLGPKSGGIQYYEIRWDNGRISKVPEPSIRNYLNYSNPIDCFINGIYANYEDFQRLITLGRIQRSDPLTNNIYALNASRTKFFPHQFKPLIKFIESENKRLLICDEVGLGKTIEAGLILLELKAREDINRVLIVCPSSLTHKWKNELDKRFGEKFEICNSNSFQILSNDAREKQDNLSFNCIISLETLRSNDNYELLDVFPEIDLTIIDEAHHLRNFGTITRKAAVELSKISSSLLMLTATPIQMSIRNLYSLLNLLDDNEFADEQTTLDRINKNEYIVQAQNYLSTNPPDIVNTHEMLLQAESSEWVRNNPIYNQVLKAINSKSLLSSKRELVDLRTDISRLNTLSHIFTRTRRKETQIDGALRKAYSYDIEFTEDEKGFYNQVTEFVQLESQALGNIPLIQAWRLNTPQRRMASSIPAMVDYYKHFFKKYQNDTDDQYLSDLEEDNDKSLDIAYEQELSDSFVKLRTLVDIWPTNHIDSKFNGFIQIVNNLKSCGSKHLIVFAFFKGTLKYLQEKLNSLKIINYMISGDIGLSDRLQIIDQFKDTDDFCVLLSSKVGTEGLDFQFCSDMVNYDIPWNPMDLEQRIGRLDRIGQESETINIYNLWVEGTIEERILKRLYERIGIFQRSIGELEVILGNIIKEIEKIQFEHNLTTEQIDKRRDNLIIAFENQLKLINQIQSESSKFIGLDRYFEEQVKDIKDKHRFVSDIQLKRFFIDFLQNYAPASRLSPKENNNVWELKSDNQMDALIRDNGYGIKLASFRKSHPILVTFDSEYAYTHPNIEFINILHPIFQLISEVYQQDSRAFGSTHQILLKSNDIPLEDGIYYYFIYSHKIYSLTPSNYLHCLILDRETNQALDWPEAETLLGKMVDMGENPNTFLETNPTINQEIIEKSELTFIQFKEELRKKQELINDSLIERKITNINNSYDREIKRKENILFHAEFLKKSKPYIKGLETRIFNLKKKKDEKIRNITKQRTVNDEYNLLSSGILKIQK